MEKSNLVGGVKLGEIAELEKELEEYLSKKTSETEREMSVSEKDYEITEQLRELGYVK